MITMTASQSEIMALTDRKVLAKIEILDSDGTWRDLCDLEDYDFFNGGSVQNSVDQPVMRADLNFASFIESLYLSPSVQSSKLNKNAAGAFSALINLRSQIKVYISIVPQEAEPETADYINVFHGKIAQITPDFSFGQEEIKTFSRDLCGDLQDNFIRTSITYPSTASETTIQSILTNSRTGVTLYTPVSPAWFTKEYAQQREPVITAINNIAKQRGWSVRYKWDSGTSAWRLTYYEPDRTKTVADHSFGPDEYTLIPSVKYDLTTIRNIVRIVYVDPSTRTEQAVEYPENGGATSGAASTLTDTSKAWTVNEWTGYELWITDGTGKGQHETISSNTNTEITIDTPWATQPDNTSRYAIVNSADSAQSLIDYGELFMEIAHDANDQINSKPEAFVMARAIYNDLSRPSVEMEIELFDLFPWVELGDLYVFEANEDSFDTDQTLAVVGYRHEFARSGNDKTILQVRGNPAGAFKQWLSMGAYPGIAPPNDFPATPTIASSTTATEIVEAQTLSYITLNLTPNAETDFDHYTARYKRSDLSDYSYIGPVANSTAPSIKIPGLAGNSTYNLGIQAVSRRGRASDWATASIVAARDTQAPSTPTLTVTSIEKGIKVLTSTDAPLDWKEDRIIMLASAEVPDNWKKFKSVVTATFSMEHSTAYDGDQNVRINMSGSTGAGSAYEYQDVTNPVSTSQIFSVYSRGTRVNTGEGFLKLEYLSSGSTSISSTETTFTPSSSAWTQQSFAPAQSLTAYTARLSFGCKAAASSDTANIEFDLANFSTGGSNLLVNPSFETVGSLSGWSTAAAAKANVFELTQNVQAGKTYYVAGKRGDMSDNESALSTESYAVAGSLTDPNGYTIIDGNGFNGKTIARGTISNTNFSDTIVIAKNIIIPAGKKWVAKVRPNDDVVWDFTSSGKTIKRLGWESGMLSDKFGLYIFHSLSNTTPGTYDQITLLVNHYTISAVTYTDGTVASPALAFSVEYEVIEENL